MISLLKKIKRRFAAYLDRRKARNEAKRAFRYDMKRFMQNAGAMHPEREKAAVAQIVMGYHVIEKGLTMPRRRPGFGKSAAIHLANLVATYEKRHGKRNGQVNHAVGVLKAYSEMHRKLAMPVSELDAFLSAHEGIAEATEPHCTRDAFYAFTGAPFAAFAASRHVIRHFAGPVDRKDLEKALEIALTAPSACNRQHVRVHVVESKATIASLFAMQGGARGFGQDAAVAIVVTADLSAIRWGWERHDAYVNGGIFTMNLCYALHSRKIAHCILHWSVAPETDRAARKLLGIPDSEEIVQVLACGTAPEEFDVAASPRLPLGEVVTWH